MSELRNVIEKLRLKKDDILVVRDAETAMQLVQLGIPIDFPGCTVILAPNGVERMTVAELEKALAEAKANEKR